MEGRRKAWERHDEVWLWGFDYEGEWKDNKIHGHGTLTFASGDQLEGEFKDHKITVGTLLIIRM